MITLTIFILLSVYLHEIFLILSNPKYRELRPRLFLATAAAFAANIIALWFLNGN